MKLRQFSVKEIFVFLAEKLGKLMFGCRVVQSYSSNKFNC